MLRCPECDFPLSFENVNTVIAIYNCDQCQSTHFFDVAGNMFVPEEEANAIAEEIMNDDDDDTLCLLYSENEHLTF